VQAQENRSTTFQPAPGGGETRSGELLLVEAYAILWVLALAFVFGSMRKQARLEARLAELASDLERARAGRPPSKGEGGDG
jgi:hypothetical protein